MRILNLYALMAGWKIATNCVCDGNETREEKEVGLLEGVGH